MSSLAKKVIVTGGNRGIGFAICKSILSDSPYHVILCSRSESNGVEAVNKLLEENSSWKGRVESLVLDVSKKESILEAVTKLSLSKGDLYAIINNAGILESSPQDVMNTNVLGVKNVCDAFIGYLSNDGRIIHLGSGAAPMFLAKSTSERVKQLTNPDITWNEIESLMAEFLGAGKNTNALGYGDHDYDSFFTPYSFSKTLLNSYTILLAREHPNLIINACSPGMIKTNLFVNYAGAKGQTVDEALSGWGAKDPVESTVAPMQLLMGENIGSGFYFGSDGKRSPMHKYRQPGTDEYDGKEGR